MVEAETRQLTVRGWLCLGEREHARTRATCNADWSTHVAVMQTARLRKALGVQKVSFDYIEGTRPWKTKDLDPNVLKLLGDNIKCWGWYGVENDATGDSTNSQDGGYLRAMFDPTVQFRYLDVDAVCSGHALAMSSTQHAPFCGTCGLTVCAPRLRATFARHSCAPVVPPLTGSPHGVRRRRLTASRSTSSDAGLTMHS